MLYQLSYLGAGEAGALAQDRFPINRRHSASSCSGAGSDPGSA